VVRVDFHCHSSFSDGALPPEGVAQMLGEAGVTYAALTDHDTVDGLLRFEEVLAARGIGFLAGMEVEAVHPLGEIHLLAFGIAVEGGRRRRLSVPPGREPPVPAVSRLRSLRATMDTMLRGIVSGSSPDPIEVVLARIHRAGGLAFLAHPLQPSGTLERLDELLADLKPKGLDGIEALYKPYPREVRSRLAGMAGRFDLLVSGGSDFHGDGQRGASRPGCDMPLWHWNRFRRALALPGSTEETPP
jgi:hypothetical protein